MSCEYLILNTYTKKLPPDTYTKKFTTTTTIWVAIYICQHFLTALFDDVYFSFTNKGGSHQANGSKEQATRSKCAQLS
jgi:hypothetical protein